MKICGKVEVYLHAFLPSALVGGDWLTPGTHFIGGFVGPRDGLKAKDV
jgi:hypothetical protein